MINNMDYNTSRSKLILPEYGRNLHKMVDGIKQEKLRVKRNGMAQNMIKTMLSINPNLKGLDEEEVKRKLWDHLFIMADFDLEVDSPFPKPTREQFNAKPRTVPYPKSKVMFRHYGGMLESLLNEIMKMNDGEEKNQLVSTFANHMKKLYLTWNRDSVTDEQIFADMRLITQGRIRIPAGLVLAEVKEQVIKKPKKKIRNMIRRK
jgi:hypothetical protein